MKKLNKSEFVKKARKDLSDFYRKADVDYIRYSASVAWKLGKMKNTYKNGGERI